MASTDPSGRPSQSPPPSRAEVQQELATRLQTLHDLGPEYTDTVAAALMDQLDPLIEAKVRQVAGQGGGKADVVAEKRKLVAAIWGISIPLIAIAGGTAGIVGVAFVAVAVCVVTLVAMTHNF